MPDHAIPNEQWILNRRVQHILCSKAPGLQVYCKGLGLVLVTETPEHPVLRIIHDLVVSANYLSNIGFTD